MSKEILVIDIDEKIHNSNVSSIHFENGEMILFTKDVKLKPMPEIINPLKVDVSNLLEVGYMYGRNDLIYKLEGEEE